MTLNKFFKKIRANLKFFNKKTAKIFDNVK